MHENLKIIGKNYEWLRKQVSKFNIKPEEALLVTLDGKRANVLPRQKVREAKNNV